MAAICARCRLESDDTTTKSIEHIRAHYSQHHHGVVPAKPKRSRKKTPAKAG